MEDERHPLLSEASKRDRNGSRGLYGSLFFGLPEKATPCWCKEEKKVLYRPHKSLVDRKARMR